MAQVQGEEIYLSHSGQEVDDNIDEVQAARGSEASLSARLAAIEAGKAGKGTFDLTIAGSPLVASEYSYSCIVTGDIATVCIRIVLGAELAVNTSRNLFKIPSGYYAPVAVAGTGYADGKVRVFWINTSGDVKIRIDEAIPAGASINANFCYSYKSTNWQTVTPASLQSVSPALMQAGRIDAELTDAQEVTENDT